MKANSAYVFVQFLLFICGCGALVPLKPSESYTHFVDADQTNPGQYMLYWKLIGSDEIQFEVHCKSTGWVGLGLSPNGGMAGADIAIGWVSNNRAYLKVKTFSLSYTDVDKSYIVTGKFKDCYATGFQAPVADKSQDWILLDGAEQDGYTILKYRRKLLSCDSQFDRNITIGTSFVIFAWNNADPVTGNNDWQYHGLKNRFQRVLMLLNYRTESTDQQKTYPKDLFTHTYRMNNVQVPAKRTYYYCDLFEYPQFEDKTHMIQFEMMVDPKYVRNIHHLLVYECNPGFNKTEELASECGAVRIPEYVQKNCLESLIIAWAIGGDYNYTFPKQAGLPFYPNADNQTRYFLLEMHYDNPELRTDIVDDSGIRLYFTKNELREYDLGLLTMGDNSPLSIQIPPNSNNYEYTTICYPECSDLFFPNDGVYAVGGLLHTHLSGRAVRTSLIRNGTLIKHLLDNPNYDFNYQYIEDIEPTKLYKFGYGTSEEMCFDFLYYYPKIYGLEICTSIAPQNVLNDFYRSLMSENLLQHRDLNDSANYHYDAHEIQSYLNTGNFSPVFSKRFEDFFKSKYNKTIFCGSNAYGHYQKENVKHYDPLEFRIDEPKLNCKNRSTTISLSYVIILLSFVISMGMMKSV